MTAHSGTTAGRPPAQGLYDPAHEHDACGLGFVAHIGGARSPDIVRQALELLQHLAHRGAVGADAETGDGAGILLQLPHAFLRGECHRRGLRLPEAGAYGLGMLFLPRDADLRAACEGAVERAVLDEGLQVLGWRDVDTDDAGIGETARRTRPAVRQLLVAPIGVERDVADANALERRLYLLRRRIEREAQALAGADAFYVASLSSRTVVYKGMLRPAQLARFYPELRHPELASAIALVHSRFSTNTFPSWRLAQPFRHLCHNGEINTLRGNLHWTRVRERAMDSPLLAGRAAELAPLVAEGQSDSACLDNVLELLVAAGRPLEHALAMLVPEAWEGDATMPAERRAFYEYHATMMEPWDGPAGLAFTDGRVVGATLDRNGLRPIRYVVTSDDRVILASEAGALRVPAEQVRAKGSLQAGRMLLVNTTQGRLLDDEAVKSELASRRPYRRWIEEHRVRLPAHGSVGAEAAHDPRALATLQRAFGYTAEELRMILAPMAAAGEEPVGSMGNDAPIAVLSERPQLLFAYFRQLFAQVTNPAIDPIREQLVMSLATLLGPQGNLLDETPAHARRIRLDAPVLDAGEMAALRAAAADSLGIATLCTLFDAAAGAAGLERSLAALCGEAAARAAGGCGVLVLSDRGVSAERAPIPALLALGAVHHHLVREGLRARTSLVCETGEARDVAQVALLVGYGAAAVHPYLALETVSALARDGVLADGEAHARAHYRTAVHKGLLKVLSKMGISTLQSYCGAQVFEAIGLARDLVARHFTGTASRLGGIGLGEIAAETLARHNAAFASRGEALDEGGAYHWRSGDERHGWSPTAIASLQHAVRGESPDAYARFSRHVDEEGRRATLRGMLAFVPGEPVPLDEVEPAAAIARRFVTGAMSFGSLSAEAHETLAVAMNRIGGRSNTGEGGEDRARFGTERNSAIKQVASGRFGVTAEYLVNAAELQIKIAQGAKPGEGGQLPGHKVDEVIARTRHATPGVSLISPPPHHDIYSIEDLAQLIHDLRCVNPTAELSVKLVAEAGVGTVAAGVTKAGADRVVISGDSGGTGASPLSSIKHAGAPWELGLAEAQQTLVLNGLRDRVRLQTDGQLKTGRDVVVAALLGADEFGFATAPLVAQGCVMMRKCHLNTCPVGIATQDPVLRARFAGQPEHVVRYFMYLAEEVRAIMASLGFRDLDQMIGRADRLRPDLPADHAKARTLDLAPLVHLPASAAPRHFVAAPPRREDDELERALLLLGDVVLDGRRRASTRLPVRNAHRAVGARLSGEIARWCGAAGLPDGSVTVRLTGSAGQSFGAFAARGLTLLLEGEANDYVGKGLSGGVLVVRPPRGAAFIPDETVIIGNTALYGATDGEAFFAGVAGQRFAVRNSGAAAVVEGVGDHGCEYMTGGTVVVMGRTGRNFAAGMSGGLAFVFDESGDFAARCNTGMVELGPVVERGARALLHRLVTQHARLTGSPRARRLLRSWDDLSRHFVAVVPTEYRRALAAPDATELASAHAARLESLRHG